MKRTYLGDGAYAAIDQDGVLVLTTENGLSVQNTVVLGSDEIRALLNFIGAEFVRRHPVEDGL